MQLLSIAQCLLMFSQHCSQACAGTVQNAKHSAPAAYHLIMHTLPGRTPVSTPVRRCDQCFPFCPLLLVIAEKVGADVVEAACVIELPALKGREKLEGLPLFVLIEKEGE